MWLPLIGARLHGWLDDLVTLTYIAGALLLGLQGPCLAHCPAEPSQLVAFAFSDYRQP